MRRNQGPMSERELFASGWTAELALEMIEQALVSTYVTYIEARVATPRWRPIRRWRLRLAARIVTVIGRHIRDVRMRQAEEWGR